MTDQPDRAVVAPITRVAEGRSTTDQDLVAVESPLEILLSHAQGASSQSIGLVMRTPGDDVDLVTGLLVSEQIISVPADVLAIEFEAETDAEAAAGLAARPAQARVTLASRIDLASLPATRILDRTSACGLCGRLAMQALRTTGGVRTPDAPRLDPAVIVTIPGRLRKGQAVFAETGGLHAAALCRVDGTPWLVREDVGRHNAVDKVVGAAFTAGRLPAIDALLAVSGRVAYEIVQKASAAGVVGIVAVGAPSSLAVEASRSAGITLIGFTRDGRFNVYAGAGRVGLI